MASIFKYRVHPAVGIARMGNSETTYFLAREKPWKMLNPEQKRIPGAANKVRPGSFIRDSQNKLCKQGARFRVFCYQYDEIPAVGASPPSLALLNVWECNSDKYEIEWTAQVANLKASKVTAATRGAVIDTPRVGNVPDPVVLKTKTAGNINARRTFTGKRVAASDPNGRLDLGSCFVDNKGRLTVLGSAGKIKRMDGMPQAPKKPSMLFWSGWEDDTGDGPITAKVKPKAGNGMPDSGMLQKDALGAWVVVNMPDYGADARATTTLYDLAINHGYEMAKEGRGFKPNLGNLISFTSQICPLMFAQYAVRFTIDQIKKPTEDPLVLPTIKRVHQSNSKRAKYIIPKTIFEAKEDNSQLSGSLRLARLTKEKTKKLRPESIWEAYKAGSLGSAPGNPSIGPRYYNPKDKYIDWSGSMPWLNFLTITEIQHKAVKEFVSGKMDGIKDNKKAFSGNDMINIPMQLDRAHMESMSGGSFYPGIETGRQVGYPATWFGHEGSCDEHYDVRVTKEVDKSGAITGDAQAGYLTHELANPWHGDFVECGSDYWPHSRPIAVQITAGGGWKTWMSKTGGGMVSHDAHAGSAVTGGLAENWWKLGFVRFDSGSDEMLEKERHRTLGISP